MWARFSLDLSLLGACLLMLLEKLVFENDVV